jgi:hypothetical protein
VFVHNAKEAPMSVSHPTKPTFLLVSAEHGVPTGAVCEACGASWERPPGDDQADTRVAWAREHERTMISTQEATS